MNRPVAEDLIKKSSDRIEVRWYETHGEQFHSKLATIKKGEQTTILLGSANFTRRNLNNFNLEANVSVTAGNDAHFVKAATAYFAMIWDNRGGNSYTVNYEAFKDKSALKRIVYLIQEYAGLSSF